MICRLQNRIAAMEDAAVGEKPWQLTGEIAGPARPENSLLQEHLEYDTAGRQAPVITEEVRAASSVHVRVPEISHICGPYPDQFVFVFLQLQ